MASDMESSHFKNHYLPWFYIQIIVRTLLITLTCGGMAYFFFREGGKLTFINLAALLVLQVALLIRYLNRTNRDLYRFFSSLKEEGASLVFPQSIASAPSKKLRQAMEQLDREWKNMQENNAVSSQYFHTVFQHVGIGLLSVYENGRIENINKAARDLLNTGNIVHLRELAQTNPELPGVLLSLQPGKARLYRFMRQNEMVQLSIKSTQMVFRGKKMQLISLQNISPELEERELESWQKLIRILTHEIMNSVAPISSTIETISEFLTDPATGKPRQVESISQETIKHTLNGLEIIEGRSKGLLEFVRQYRKLTSLSQPTLSTFRIRSMLDSLALLMAERMEQEKIKLVIRIEPADLEMRADRKLMEQVFINLMNNAMEALESTDLQEKTISISACTGNNGKLRIEVEDNGRGIPQEIIEQIFIPFFTTRDEGTGIGLSLSRNILRMHQGTIRVMSEPGIMTRFILEI